MNSKLHAVCDGAGRPIVMLLTEGQMSDHKGAVLLFDALPNAKELLGDKPVLSEVEGGYDSDWFRAALKAGEQVLITGASGGVGSAAVQLARRRGAQVTAMAGADKAEAVRGLGATRVIPRDADLAALFGPEHFDAAVDIVGGAGFASILNSLKRGGRYGVAGATSGPIVDSTCARST